MSAAARTICRAVLLAMGAGAAAAHAAVFRIDESGTVVSQPVATMQWRNPVPGRGRDDTLEATLRIDARLNLQPWLNRPARVYLVLAPLASGERVQAQWTTQGRLMQGRMYSGERVLVYEGPAQPAVLSDALVLTLRADSDTMGRQHTLKFHFEIEVTP